MRAFSLRFLLVVTIGLLAAGGLAGAPVALADGGGRNDDTGTAPREDAPRPVVKKDDKGGKTVKPDKKAVPAYRDYRDSRLPEIIAIQRKLQGYAKADGLKGLATTRKRLEAFVRQMKAMGNRYRGSRSLEFNRIMQQLQRYSTQKSDKRLARYAKGILRAFETFDEEARVAEKRAKYDAAVKEGNAVKQALSAAEYSDARGDYHRSVKRLPPEMRKLFTPAPRLD